MRLYLPHHRVKSRRRDAIKHALLSQLVDVLEWRYYVPLTPQGRRVQNVINFCMTSDHDAISLRQNILLVSQLKGCFCSWACFNEQLSSKMSSFMYIYDYLTSTHYLTINSLWLPHINTSSQKVTKLSLLIWYCWYACKDDSSTVSMFFQGLWVQTWTIVLAKILHGKFISWCDVLAWSRTILHYPILISSCSLVIKMILFLILLLFV